MKTCNAISFTNRIKWRIRALWGLLTLMLVYMVVIGELGYGDSRMMTPLADDVSRTIFFGGMLWVISKIVRNKKLLRNRAMLKAQQQKELDEGNQYLHDKSGGIVWDSLFVCLLFITVTTALINMPAFYTSFIILCLAVLAKLAAYCFYKYP